MKVAVVILNWNGEHFLQQFLPSLVRHTHRDIAEIIVADNGSTDNSKQVVADNFPTVSWLQLEKNWGFAAGYNHALEKIEADYFVLINSDIEVSDRWLEPLLDRMEQHPGTAICQPSILSFDKPDYFEYGGAAGGFLDRFGFPFCRGRILQEVEKNSGQYDQPLAVNWASGACMMIRSDVWRQLGGFDEKFWAHMEEIDLCWRARHLGYGVYAVPSSKVWHVGGGTLPYDHPRKIYLNFRNNLFLLTKNLPSRSLFTTLFLRMILDGIAAGVFLITGRWQSFIQIPTAHLHFYRNRSDLMKKRAEIQRSSVVNTCASHYRGSIVVDYFIRKKRKFSDLKF